MKITNLTKKILKPIFGALVVAIAGVVLSLPAGAWGPERDTFTMAEPATYPVFNSIKDHPVLGDERDFVRVGEINTAETDLKDEVEVIPGKQYLVYIYFHNNASATFNDTAHNRSGVATAVRMSTSFPTVLTPNEKGKITGTITASNTNPLSVWDEAYFTTKTSKVLLHYVEGSAKIYNDWQANGSVMPSHLFTEEGTAIGLNALNGVIPGCEEYSGVVSYVLQAEELSGTIEKSVSKDGEEFFESVDVLPGDEVYFRLTIKNTGDVELGHATVKDVFPETLSLIPDSVYLTANSSTIKDKLSDDIIKTGYNFGTIGTGNIVYITYKAKVKDDIDCSEIKIKNLASLTYDSETESGDTSEDSAEILVQEVGCESILEDEPGLPSEIVQTGPLEIIFAIIIVLGIGGGCFYLYRSRKNLKKVEDSVSGISDNNKKDNKKAQKAEREENSPKDEK